MFIIKTTKLSLWKKKIATNYFIFVKETIVYQTALLQVCFSHNPACCIGLEVLILTKQRLLIVSTTRGV